jgi:hypothetical protein
MSASDYALLAILAMCVAILAGAINRILTRLDALERRKP